MIVKYRYRNKFNHREVFSVGFNLEYLKRISTDERIAIIKCHFSDAGRDLDDYELYDVDFINFEGSSDEQSQPDKDD